MPVAFARFAWNQWPIAATAGVKMNEVPKMQRVQRQHMSWAINGGTSKQDRPIILSATHLFHPKVRMRARNASTLEYTVSRCRLQRPSRKLLTSADTHQENTEHKGDTAYKHQNPRTMSIEVRSNEDTCPE